MEVIIKTIKEGVGMASVTPLFILPVKKKNES